MKNPFESKLPEISREPFADWIERNVRLQELELPQQRYFLNFLVEKIAFVFGGTNHFWKDQASREMFFVQWKSGLDDLTIKRLICGLYALLNGETEYFEKPPRTPMQFFGICKEAHISDFKESENPVLLLNGKIQTHEEKSAIAQANLKKIREMIGSAFERAHA